MRKTPGRLISGIFLAGAMLAGAWAAGDTLPVLPLAKSEVSIDGQIAEGEWEDALYLGKMEGAIGTEAWVRFDGEHLLVAIRCEEPTPSKLKVTTLADEIKGTVWLDDSVEVVIDPGNTGGYLWQVVANSEGTIYDGVMANGQAVADAWHSGAVARTRVGESEWTAELKIPLEGIGHRLVKGEVIALNVSRARYAGGKREVSSYAGSRVHAVEGFRRVLVQGPIRTESGAVIVTQRGPFRYGEEGKWQFELLSGDWAGVNLSLNLPEGEGERLSLQPDADHATRATISFPALQAGRFRTVEVMSGDEVLYRSSYEMREVERPQRFASIEQPLFEELIEKRPNGLSGRGVFNWTMELSRPLMKVVPFRAAMPYRHSVTPYENYARDRSILIVSPPFFRRYPEMVRTGESYELEWLIYPHYYGALKKGVPTFDPKGTRSEKHIWILDPRAKEAYLEEVRAGIDLAAKHPGARWIFAGDEHWERLHRSLLAALDRKEDYPELAAADREIREKYGFGRYGLPHSSTDENPFRWIATYRWEVDQMMATAVEVRKMIAAKAPEMKFVSWDSMTGHRPYAIDRWGEVFDVITAQIYPAFGKDRDHIGFTTKFYADLSNVDEIWPVPHFEHFPDNFTAEETRIILSMMMRGGATGMHIWAGDHINESVHRKGTSIVDRIGAPERWNVVRSLIDRMQEPFRVRHPEPDTAIFYSNTSFQSTGAPPTFHRYNQCEWIYTVLGPKLGGAIRFIDEFKVSRDPGLLKKFRAVYLPFIPIADDPEYAALEAYVREGGMLVICDPLAFRHRSDGVERSTEALLPPVFAQAQKPTGRLVQKLEDGSERELSPMGDVYPFQKIRGKVLLWDKRGTPMVLEQRLGEGRVIFMAQNPAAQRLISEPAWAEFFRDLQLSAGAELGHDVWRFLLPEAPPLKEDRPEGVCLTDNYFEWSYSKPKPMANARIGGSYRVEGPVDLFGREPLGEEIDFAEGRLTDRIAGANAPNEAKRSAYTLLCRSSKPWAIRFQYQRAARQRLVRLLFGGEMPAGHCEVSADGENWVRAGDWESAAEAEDDVGMIALPLSSSEPTRFLRLHFQESGKRSLELVEVEVWAD